MARSTDLVTWLRAAGEPTRLRLLVLCAERDFSVSDLALAVHQSEPRVSRHLKILCDAGLVVRVRHGQWVHYRLTDTEPALGFAQALLAQLDKNDPVRVSDRERIQQVAVHAAHPAAPLDSRLGRALRAFIESSAPLGVVQNALVVGVDHIELLEAAARRAAACTALAHSRRAAQRARTAADSRSFTCQVLLATNGEPLSERDTQRAGAPFDAIVLDRFSATGGELAAMLHVARQALAPGGRLWLFERYESLETPGKRVVEHPLARVRRLLTEAGLRCEKLSPIEAEGEHVLAAFALPVALLPGLTQSQQESR